MATEEFSIESIKSYLTKENPYIYGALLEQSISKEQLNYVKGEFDTRVVAKYDDKDYPVTSGKYYSAGFEKATEFGIDLSAGYRYSEGTQEYNNIKTDKNGEFIVGAKIPLISVLSQIDARRVRLSLAKMTLKNREFAYQENMRKLTFNLMSEYSMLLHDKGVVEVTQRLLHKVVQRELYIQKSVASGNLAEAALLEVRQQMLTRTNALISAQRAYENRLISFLKYLNISKEDFNAEYHLGSLMEPRESTLKFDEALLYALEMRPDLAMLQVEIEKLLIENKNNERLAYPEIDLGLYGVHDVNNESGFKVALNMSFAVERTQYRSKSSQIRERINSIRNSEALALIELRVDLESVLTSLETLKNNIEIAREELLLLRRVEEMERKKYTLGSSSLFLLNQREMLAMQAEKRVLSYKLEYQLLYQTYKRIINKELL